MKHDWAQDIRDGSPVLVCGRAGCRMVWWPWRNEPKSECAFAFGCEFGRRQRQSGRRR